MVSQADIHYMRSALAMARRGLGRTAPNPSVGCVVVKNGVVVARARTADSGRPHAETVALELAGNAAKGATLYVTLEPCVHEGETPPCSDAIIQSGVSRVVIGTTDKDPRVAQKSRQVLEDAGIEVVTDALEEDCAELNEGFFKSVVEKRPYITLKSACSLDGKIACSNGESQWITGELARRHVHQLRSQHDAILIGSGTALHDDPSLTTRLDGVSHRPIRIVLDRRLETPLDSALVRSATDVPLWLFYEEEGKNHKRLSDADVVLHKLEALDPDKIVSKLVEGGVTRLLIEGGSQIHASFLQQGLCDAYYIYRAPRILGADALSVVSDMNITTLAESHDFGLKALQNLGDDVLEIYRRNE